MKILEINSVCNGSTGKIACEISKKLIEQEHECIVAFGRGNPPKDIPYIKIGKTLSIYFHLFITRLFDLHGYGSKIATLKFIKQIKKYDPDVIHLHNLHGYYLNMKLLFTYFKKANKKVIWTLHDCWSFTGHCAHFENIKCDRWKTQCKKCKLNLNYPKAYLSFAKRNFNYKKKIFTLIDSQNLFIVTPSNWLCQLVKQSFLKKYECMVINNSIDAIFHQISSNLRILHKLENKKIILGVSSVWTKSKGLEDFYKLSQKISSQYQIVLIGLNKKQLKTLPNNILGFTRTESVQKLVEWYSVADVFFNPTYEDTYPTVNLEAIACHTPVITYKTGGSPEAIKNSGFIVEKGDIDRVIEIIQQINIYRFDFEITYTKKDFLKKYLKLLIGGERT